LLIFGAGSWLAAMIFGDSERVDWLPPLVVALVGYSFYTVVFSFWRGQLQIGRSSAVLVSAFAVTPVLVVGFTVEDVFTGMIQMGVCALGVAAVFFPWRSLLLVPARAIIRRARELASYGAPRLVCGAMLALLFALPAIHATRQSSLELAGVLAFGVTVV